MRYTLENDDLVVTFTSLGGALTSIKNKAGLEYLWQGDATYWSGQAPILFPICGSLRQDRATTLDGRSLHMPRHGLARKLPFTCDRQTDDTIIFSLSSSSESQTAYPYAFRLVIRYQLVGNQIRVCYQVFNDNAVEMPFCIGAHPGFNCPLEENLAFTDYQVVFEKPESPWLPQAVLSNGLIDRENRRFLSFDGQTLPMAHDLFKQDALIFENCHSRAVTLASPKGRASILLEYPDFPNLLIWSTANNGPFVALEPMVGLSTALDEDDIFEHKSAIQRLQAGEEATYHYRMTFS